jgi:hypothetical protein
MAERKNRIVEEAIRRSGIKAPSFSVNDYCFQKQLAFVLDPARFKTAVCSRRSGKTVACAADLMDTANTLKGDVAYITLNRVTAKRIIWRELLKINKEFGIGARPDNTELTLTLPNGNVIYVSGAKDSAEIEKFRGLALRKVYIDECQSFRAYIKDLVEDVIEPALTDYYGSLCLIGTPGPVPAGFFYDASTSNGYSNHHWTMQENPYIRNKSGKDPLEIIREIATRRGLTIDDPSIQREYFGRWIKDVNSLVYRFDSELNTSLSIPTDLVYVFGIDIGWVDSDAIAVLGYNFATKEVYLVDELITPKQDITALVGQINELKKKYPPTRMVMDAGALGKKIQDEIRQRHSLHIDAAEKTRKQEFIKLLNDDMRTGKFKAKPNSRFAEDSFLVTWDYDDPMKPKISDKYHTDIGDAVLYAWRECRHYFAQPVKGMPKYGTPEYFAAQDQIWEEQEEAKFKKDAEQGPFDESIDLEKDEFWEKD